MGLTVGATPAGSDLERARGRTRAGYVAIRVLALAAVAVVTITSFQSRPAPGLHGSALGVTLALAAFALAILTAIYLPDASDAANVAVLLVALGSAAALVGLQPGGAAILGLFPAVSITALILAERRSAVLVALAMTALGFSWVLGGHGGAEALVLNEFGVVGFYLLSLVARRLKESNDRAELLLAELERTRDAQASAAALAERQRLAREMHDVLAHSLSGLVLNLEGARLLARRHGAQADLATAIDRAHRLARSGLDEARRAIGMLRDDELLPGPERLAGLAAEFAADTGVACTVTVTGEPRELGADGRLAVYRVAQEALTNVRKHARAQRVCIGLAYDAGGVRLTIEDVGQAGADARRAMTAAPSGEVNGYGLTGMRERAELIGGTLVTSSTEHGYVVELWVPS